MKTTHKNPLAALRYHVSGAIARGEAVAVVETPSRPSAFDRFFNGGKRPSDAMDLAIADAIAAKLETASPLIQYREANAELALYAQSVAAAMLSSVAAGRHLSAHEMRDYAGELSRLVANAGR